MRAAFATLALMVALAGSAHAATPALATPALSNTSTLATYLRRNFTAAGITKPNELETRVQAGIVPSAGSSDLTCTFHLVGEGISSAVDVLSLDPSSQATGLSSASISCTGGSGDASFQGGSALAQFTSNFSGTFCSVQNMYFCNNFTTSYKPVVSPPKLDKAYQALLLK